MIGLHGRIGQMLLLVRIALRGLKAPLPCSVIEDRLDCQVSALTEHDRSSLRRAVACPGWAIRTSVLWQFISQLWCSLSMKRQASPNRLPKGRAGDGPAPAA